MKKSEQKIKWEPQPRQELALASNGDEILFGGSRGGGKTDAGQAWLMYDIGNPKYRALVIRRNATDLSDWIDRAQGMFAGAGGKLTGDKFTFPSGARIRTGHLADKDSYQKYQGHEYQKMLIEELTHIPRESDYEKLIASCRSTVEGIKPQIFNTTNPDGSGHEWVKERWSIPDIPDDSVLETFKDIDIGVDDVEEIVRRKIVFVPSKVSDNKYLRESKEYMSFLNSIQDEELKRAWLEGSWEGFGVEGAYYKDQLNRAQQDKRIVSGLYDPLLPVYTWCDLGIADSFSIGYAQLAHSQWRFVDYEEFEGESLKDAINRMKEKGYTYAEHYAPHDIEVRELSTGVSRRDTALGLGVDYNVVPKLLIQDGIDALRTRFINIWFDKDKCAVLLKRLRRYHKEFDEKRGVYKNKPAHDENSHAADMMRYFATTEVYTPDIRRDNQIRRNRQKHRGYQ